VVLSFFAFIPAGYGLAAGEAVGAFTRYTTVREDNLYDVARRFDVGIVELLAANPNIDPWMPTEGSELAVPTVHVLPEIRKGIVINLSALRLFYFGDDGKVLTFPIGIGREGWQTPVGTAKIVAKKKNPEWRPPPSIRKENPDLPEVFPAGEDNPLGDYAMYLGWSGVLIHSTNRPYGVGKRSSHGCIRLYPEDMEVLFKEVKIGTKVTVIDKPYSVGWKDDLLFLEVKHSQNQLDEIAEYKVPVAVSIPEIYDAIRKSAGEEGAGKKGMAEIDWYKVEEAVAKRSGIPTIIGRRI